MNRREAKKHVCLEMGRALYRNADELIDDDPDARRIREAGYELAAEMLRRGGAEREAQVADERQMSIFEVEGV